MATHRRTHPRAVSGTKRPRSPDHALEILPKRLKAGPAGPVKEVDNDKARRHAEREQQRIEFKDKYRRAFPGWRFYFDIDNIHAENASSVKVAQAKIRQLGGSIENFFSNTITHFITDQTASPEQPPVPSADKENDAPRFRLKSPIKLKGTAADDIGDLVSKARGFDNTKIWNLVKLMSVVDRCLEVAPSTSAPMQRSLSTLLQSERLHGTTERDPTQKRHDYKYFSRGTYFMMVEDIREELATIAVQEYIIPKGRDAANAKVPWPVLYCHPHARSPFLPFDEKEKRRWEKTQRLEKQEAGERQERQLLRVEAMKRKAEAQLLASHQGCDLRRSASMNNMHRRAKLLDEQALIDLDGDVVDCGGRYVAASGNSVGITSTTGTTSTAGLSFTSTLPASLRGRQEVLTSLKFPSVKAKGGDMGPPISVPERRPALKKSRSTNTMRLPKRDEGSKPGYCECCRQKFADFVEHIAGRRHRKFAMDDSNFLQLDYILARVKRRTLQETQEEERDWKHKCAQPRSGGDDDDDTLMFSGAFVDLDC